MLQYRHRLPSALDPPPTTQEVAPYDSLSAADGILGHQMSGRKKPVFILKPYSTQLKTDAHIRYKNDFFSSCQIMSHSEVIFKLRGPES